MADDYPEASLLGLPVELRLKIYEYVTLTDMDCKIIDDVRHSRDSTGTHAIFVAGNASSLASGIPWIALGLTCKKVANELRDLMDNTIHCKDHEFRTYVLDLAIDWEDRRATRSVIWRQLPCEPCKARFVVMNVVIHSGLGPWTEGGAASLARALFQILNRTMHLGPNIRRGTLLQQHMSTEQLHINVDIGRECKPPAEGCNTQPKGNWDLFVGGWKQICKTGFLTSFVETTTLQAYGVEEVVVGSEYQKVPAVPGYWRGYGFQWGVECAGYQSL